MKSAATRISIQEKFSNKYQLHASLFGRLAPRHARFSRLLHILSVAILLGTTSLHIHSTLASPVSSPTPVPTLTPNRHAEQVARAFYAAYDRRDVPAIFALFPKTFRYVDCDYAQHRMVFIETKPVLRRWLAARFREHDRFGPLGSLIADPGPGKAGVVGPVSRYSDSIEPLVARGLLPTPNDGLGKLIVKADGLLDLVLLTNWDWCAAGALPRGAMPKKEHALARTFVDRYNRHDVAGVAALLSDTITYMDCDFSRGATVTLAGKPAVAAWLRARFAQGDRLVHPRIVLRSWLNEASGSTAIVIEGGRTSAAFGAAPWPLSIRIIPDSQVRHISTWQVWSPCSDQPSA